MSRKIGWYSETAAKASETASYTVLMDVPGGGTKELQTVRKPGVIWRHEDGHLVQVTAVMPEGSDDKIRHTDKICVGPVVEYVRDAAVGERLPNTKVQP